MKGFIKKTLDWQLINQIGENFNTVNIIDKAKTDILEWVEQVLDYNDEEKTEIDDLMKKVNEINSMIESWKSFSNTLAFGIFLLWYRNATPRVKCYFEKNFNELSVLWAKEKIKHLLDTPFISWKFDEANLSVYVKTILDLEPNFDFSVYDSDVLDEIVLYNIKHHKN